VLRWTAHFWSLAIEEQFYFVWPIVAIMVPRRRLTFAQGARERGRPILPPRGG